MKHTSCVLILHQVLHNSHDVLHHNDIMFIFSLGQWIVPLITGTRPPPCAEFIMHRFSDNKGVMFGGYSIDETGLHRVNDLFIFSCTQNTIVS